MTHTLDYAIPLRPDLNVALCGIPFDLTKAEADRLCRLIQTLVIPEALGPDSEGL